MARKQEPLTVTTRVRQGERYILLEDMSKEERNAFWIRANKRAIRNVERSHGNEVIFEDEAEPPKTVTA